MEHNESLNAALKKIASDQLGGAEKINFIKNSFEGEGYLGIVIAVDVKGKNGELNLIVKSANSSKQVREKIPLEQCVKTETVFYETIVPAFAKFCAERGVNNALAMLPKIYYVAEEIIIMDNLKPQGYELWDRMKPMNREHAESVMKELGKFHALSFAYKEERASEFQQFAIALGDNIRNWMVLGGLMDVCVENLNYIKGMVDGSMQGKLTELIAGAREFILELDFMGDEYAVISHADCWCNNLMFKCQKETNTIESLKIIDFQLTRVSPFPCDLTHFLGTCCDQTVWNNLDHYLRIYHSALSERMRELGTKRNITFTDLMDQFKKYAKYGLIVDSFFMKVTCIQGHEAPTFDDAMNHNFVRKFAAKLEYESVYIERMKFLVEYYYKNGLM